MEIIIGRKGNQKTPITDPTVSREHCKVIVNGDGSLTIENLSDYGTKVDGRNIIRSSANLNSRIQLGNSFSATLVELIGNPAASQRNAGNQNASISQSPTNSFNNQSQPKPKEEVQTFNISHLKKVWEDYNNTNIEVAEKQRRINLTRTAFAILTMFTVPIAFFFQTPWAYLLTAIGILGNIYSFIGLKNAESPSERQHRQDAFDDAWVCPNPKCGHSLMAKNYKLLVRNFQACPYCKSKYVER